MTDCVEDESVVPHRRTDQVDDSQVPVVLGREFFEACIGQAKLRQDNGRLECARFGGRRRHSVEEAGLCVPERESANLSDPFVSVAVDERR